MGSFKMTLEGLPELQRALRRKSAAFVEEMATTLPREGHTLEQEANARAPRLTGELVSSSSVTSERTKGRVSVAVAYLDDKAAAVHEGIHHGRYRPGTRGFQWFARVLALFESGFKQRIVQRLRALAGAR